MNLCADEKGSSTSSNKKRQFSGRTNHLPKHSMTLQYTKQIFAVRPRQLREQWLSYSSVAADTDSMTEEFQMLLHILDIQHYGTNPRSTAYMDFMFQILCFARNEAKLLSREKEAQLLYLSSQLFEYAMTMEPESEKMKQTQQNLTYVKQVYQIFRGLIKEAATSQQAPVLLDRKQAYDETTAEPTTIASEADNNIPNCPIFSVADVSYIVRYMTMTFFRHLKAYQYVFTCPRDSVHIEKHLFVEDPLSPTPLCDSVLMNTMEITPQ